MNMHYTYTNRNQTEHENNWISQYLSTDRFSLDCWEDSASNYGKCALNITTTFFDYVELDDGDPETLYHPSFLIEKSTNISPVHEVEVKT